MNQRPIPHDLDAERVVLGSMLLYPQARSDALSMLVADDFYAPRHGSIFAAVLSQVVAGKPIELVAVAAQLQAQRVEVDRSALLELQMKYGAASWIGSVRVVAELSARRRMLSEAERAEAAAYDRSKPFDDALAGWERAVERIRTPDATPERATNIVELVAGEESAWAVPGALRRRERIIVTGGEGAGKSELGRWVAMSVAAGRAPFSPDPIEALPTLIVDLENEDGDIGDAARRIQRQLGYSRGCTARARPQGIDLTQPRDVRWLNSLVDGERPALLVIGPLYKMYRGAENRSKSSEEAAEIVAGVLDDLRVMYDCALWIEAHAPHGEGGNRELGRPKGSSLWLGWPNFGRYLERQRADRNTIKFSPWRGDRHRDRSFPWGFRESSQAPWAPIWTDPAKAQPGPEIRRPKETPFRKGATPHEEFLLS